MKRANTRDDCPTDLSLFRIQNELIIHNVAIFNGSSSLGLAFLLHSRNLARSLPDNTPCLVLLLHCTCVARMNRIFL